MPCASIFHPGTLEKDGDQDHDKLVNIRRFALGHFRWDILNWHSVSRYSIENVLILNVMDTLGQYTIAVPEIPTKDLGRAHEMMVKLANVRGHSSGQS